MRCAARIWRLVADTPDKVASCRLYLLDQRESELFFPPRISRYRGAPYRLAHEKVRPSLASTSWFLLLVSTRAVREPIAISLSSEHPPHLPREIVSPDRDVG